MRNKQQHHQPSWKLWSITLQMKHIQQHTITSLVLDGVFNIKPNQSSNVICCVLRTNCEKTIMKKSYYKCKTFSFDSNWQGNIIIYGLFRLENLSGKENIYQKHQFHLLEEVVASHSLHSYRRKESL